MSFWTYVHGTITVSPMGRTQHEMRYILETVLDHLPRVTGSEGDMNVYIIQKNGHNCSSSHDEFGERTNNAKDHYGGKSRKYGHYEKQSDYILVVDGALRDCLFKQTFKEFMKWICRLSKRVTVLSAFVSIDAYDGRILINDSESFYNMFEDPSWCRENPGDNGMNWCEYLMWNRAKGSDYPMALAYKYFADPENDAEYERRRCYDES